MSAKTETARGGIRSSRHRISQEWQARMGREEDVHVPSLQSQPQTQTPTRFSPASLSTLIQRIKRIEGRPEKIEYSQLSLPYEGHSTVVQEVQLKQRERTRIDIDIKQIRSKTAQTTTKSARSVRSRSHERDEPPWRFGHDGCPSITWNRSSETKRPTSDILSKSTISDHDFYVQGEFVRAASAPPRQIFEQRWAVSQTSNNMLQKAAKDVSPLLITTPQFHSLAHLECHELVQHGESGRCERCIGRYNNKNSCRRVGGGFVLLEKVILNCNNNEVIGGEAEGSNAWRLPAVTAHGAVHNGLMQPGISNQETINRGGGKKADAFSLSFTQNGTDQRYQPLTHKTELDGTAHSEGASETAGVDVYLGNAHARDGSACVDTAKTMARGGIKDPTAEQLPTMHTDSGRRLTTGEAWIDQEPTQSDSVSCTNQYNAHVTPTQEHYYKDKGTSLHENATSENATSENATSENATSETARNGTPPFTAQEGVVGQADQFIAGPREKRKKMKKKIHRNQEQADNAAVPNDGSAINSSMTLPFGEDDLAIHTVLSDPATLACNVVIDRQMRRRPSRRTKVVEVVSESSSEDETGQDDTDFEAHQKYSILGEAKRARYKQVFQNIDVNGDGSLSIDELKASLSAENEGWGSGDASDEEHVFMETLLSVSSQAVEDGLDFKTFCIVVALSVWSFDEIDCGGNKMGPEAMNAKVEIAKDLFQMLEPDSHGNVRIEQVKYALLAGNIKTSVINGIIAHLHVSAEEAGGRADIINFMDVLTYLPLFALAHSQAKKTDSIF